MKPSAGSVRDSWSESAKEPTLRHWSHSIGQKPMSEHGPEQMKTKIY